MNVGDQKYDYALKFEPEGGGVKATLISPRSGEHPVESAALEKQDFKMRVKRNFNGTEVTFVYTGRLENGALSGKAAVEGYDVEISGDWAAKKKSAK